MNIDLVKLRDNIVKAIEDRRVLFTDYPLIAEYDDTLVVNTLTQTDPFVCVRIKLLDGEQADLSSNPLHRIWGVIELAAVVKEGSGSRKALAVLTHFYPALHMGSFGTSPRIRTKSATFAPKQSHNGWVYTPVVIPFWCDGNLN